MGRGVRRRTVGAAAVTALVAGGVALASNFEKGRIGPSLGITANGRVLHPVGRQTVVGNFPTGSALTPGSTVMVEPAPDGAEEADEVKLTVIEPKPAPTPVGVGAEGGSEAAEGEGDGGSPEPSAPDLPEVPDMPPLDPQADGPGASSDDE